MKSRFLLLLLLAAQWAWSAPAVYSSWNGKSQDAVTPTGRRYAVSSAAELAWLSAQSQTYDFAGDTIAIQTDIDLKDSVWTPVGSAAVPFAGVVEGQQHLVRGLSQFSRPDGLGLFGYIASTGKVTDLGISGGRLLADQSRCVGSLVGVNRGVVARCWTMAEVLLSGHVTGGLVGWNEGVMEDVYASSLILQADDTIGALVGANKGIIRRAYSSGYAKNGYGFVGADLAGTYSACYYDRKLYYQEPGVVCSGLTPEDATASMFTLFSGNSAWSTAAGRYPVLAGFANTDAALLSAAPVLVDASSVSPVNHLNDLTLSFTVSTDNGVHWAVENAADAEWIAFSGSSATVTRPCTQNDILTDAMLGQEKHVVYMRVRPIDDLLAGRFGGDPVGFCQPSQVTLKDWVTDEDASNGWTLGDYYYTVYLYKLSGADTVPVDTLIENYTQTQYDQWYDNYSFSTDSAGRYLMRRYVHDEGCIRDDIPSDGGWVYWIYNTFHSGAIVSGRDTLYGAPETVDVASLMAAYGGQESTITYQWWVNGKQIAGQSDDSLKAYVIDSIGTYTFTRTATDGFCQSLPEYSANDGAYTYVIFDTIQPGALQQDTLYFCSEKEAQQAVVSASQPQGGNGRYVYRWTETVDGHATIIAGAEADNLLLTGRTFAAGTYYTYTREVKDDSRFTDWKQSLYATTVYVWRSVDAGVIPTADRGVHCWPAEDETAHTISVQQQTAASCPDGAVEYAWYRKDGQDSVLVGTTADLRYTLAFADVVAGQEYTYVRYARHGDCEWVRSAGEVKESYEKGTITKEEKLICSSDMPYEYVVDSLRHTFTYNNEVYRYVGKTASGCEQILEVTAKVTTVPDVHVDGNAKLCQNDSLLYIYFGLNNNALVNQFQITYSDDMAKYMGVTDTIGAVAAPENDGMYCIVLHNVPYIGTGDIYLTLQVGAAGSTCMSLGYRISFDISLGGYLHEKFGRVLYIDNNPDNGEVAGTKLHFVTYQWYREGVIQTGKTGQYYSEDGKALSGTYYCIVESDDHVFYRTCDITMDGTIEPASTSHVVVAPSPAEAGSRVAFEAPQTAVGMMVIGTMGEIVNRTTLQEGETTFDAPQQPGVYTLRLTMEDGSMMSAKFMVY